MDLFQTRLRAPYGGATAKGSKIPSIRATTENGEFGPAGATAGNDRCECRLPLLRDDAGFRAIVLVADRGRACGHLISRLFNARIW